MGCANPAEETTSSEIDEVAVGDEVFNFAVNLLNRLDQFDALDAPDEAVAQLNQWIEKEPGVKGWKPDPMVQSLPANLAALRDVKAIGKLQFPETDARELRQVAWLREVAKTACAGVKDDLERAQRLFDWTVRNIQLETEKSGKGEDSSLPLPKAVWQALLLGRGRIVDRGWTFILLARQQGLDVVWLGRAPAKPGARVVPWVTALVLNGELYLFDPRLGLPIPGPQNQGVATLSQVAADDTILRQLDLDDEHAYPLHAQDVAQVVALLEASPIYLSQRMKVIQDRLAGDRKFVLSFSPSLLAKRLKALPQVKEVQLWTLPLERLRPATRQDLPARKQLIDALTEMTVSIPVQAKEGMEWVPALWKARTLHLLGVFSAQQGGDAGTGAIFYYLLARANEDDGNTDKQILASRAVARQAASYWMGVLQFEMGKPAVALDYLKTRTLAMYPDSPWTKGAYYNLARVHEALGNKEQAIEAYRAIGKSPQSHGNLLCARALEQGYTWHPRMTIARQGGKKSP